MSLGVKIIASAVLACIVAPDDGDDVVERAEDSMRRWIEAHMADCQIGDEIMIVRRSSPE